MLSEKTLELLRQYDTPTICNVIELFEVRPRNTGYMDNRIRACYPELPPAVGYASTATFRSSFRPEGASVYKTLDEQVRRIADLPGPAMVVFQDLDDPPAAATFGEIMCASYQGFGAAGLITSGAARDIEQVRRLQFPTFASCAICSHGYSTITSLGESIRVGGLPVRDGDLLHADANGVTNIPLEIAPEVAGAAAEYVAAESVILDFIKTGARDAARYSECRSECMNRIRALGTRLRSARTATTTP